MYEKIKDNAQIPLHHNFSNIRWTRLKSRKPPLSFGKKLYGEDFNVENTWRDEWDQCQRQSPLFEFTATSYSNVESSLPRKSLCNLNRLRTGHGRCKSCLYKWGLADETCECGHPRQTMNHIINDCSILSYQGNLEDLKNLTSDAKIWLRYTL
ncbi:hypothetical protein M8J77_015702 [Diaphorina citri]|jgi:hypothetical protein|nr:hypothetical protein M8J77_015702 [Diaphorina citri]